MTSKGVERLLLLLLGTLNVGCGAALLAASDLLPQPARVGIVVFQAMLAWALTQLNSWQTAGQPVPRPSTRTEGTGRAEVQGQPPPPAH